MSFSISAASSIPHTSSPLFDPSRINGLVTPARKQSRPAKIPLFCKAQLGLAELAPATSATYGTLLLGGGLFAYTRSGSKGSLAGGVSGVVLMATVYYLMQAPETKHAADALGFGSAFIFSAVFSIRLAGTRKFIPSGALPGLSVVALTVFVSAYLQEGI